MKLMVDMSTDIISEVEINESTNDKTYVIKGTFSSPGKKNKNGRIYSRDIWEDNVKKYQNEIKNNTINTLSELEHPPRSTVDQWEAVAKTRLLEMRDGIVYGEMEILNNNDKKTNQIKALIDAGISIGVSTRGVGRMKGSIVEEYNLITTDIVSNPSDFGANLQGFNESMILESEEYTVTDGKIVCNENGCTIENIKSSCSSTASDLLTAMNNYSAPEVKLSEAQRKALDLIEGLKLKDNDGKALKSFDYHGDTYKIIKVLKGEVIAVGPDGKEESFDLNDVKAQDDNVAIIEGSEAQKDSIVEGKNDQLADKLLASLPDTKSQHEFERKNGSVYKMSKEELLKHLEKLDEADKDAVYLAKLNKTDKVVQDFLEFTKKIDKDVYTSLNGIWEKKFMPPAIAFKNNIED